MKKITVGMVAGVTLVGIGGWAAPAGASSTVHSAALSVSTAWSVSFPDAGGTISTSSPTVATLDKGGQSALVGDAAGHVYALHLSNGSEVVGWPASTGGVPVASAPSSLGSEVFVGAGSTANPHAGGYESFAANGALRWVTTVPALPTPSAPAAVASSLAVGMLQGQESVISGALGQLQDALNANSGGVLPGFPYFEADTNFSSPAIADLYGNGQNEIIEGGDSTAGQAFGTSYSNGGHIRVLSGTGSLLCEDNTNQVIESAPAVGEFLSGGAVGIVTGTGNFYPGASNTDQLIAIDSHCAPKWSTTLDGTTYGGPALVDALGNGHLQVAEGTNVGNADQSGSVWLLNGANGKPIWRTTALGAVIGGVASVDLGSGYQDLVVGTTNGLEILDGRNGSVVWTQHVMGIENTPLVTANSDGTVGITTAGYNGSGDGTVVHYEIAGTQGSRVTEAGSWPMFHHDAQSTGDAGTPAPKACAAPSSPAGYYLAAASGEVFPFGNAPSCGSPDVALSHPIIGMTPTSNLGGYWLVAVDGGIFNYGNARYYGSTGNVRLNKPIVGIARTHDNGGYWLDASDGGIFTFGDAHFYGSTGNVRLNKPVVGMAPTADGKGYWLVASDGGIFTFGDAHFYGSTGNVRLNKPIVGMAPTPDGKGYWLVASDGGIFTFGDAHFYGSTGNVHLVKPVEAMAATPDGKGYWMVASDGGIFTFGDAHFYGSTGGGNWLANMVAIAP